MGVGTPFYARPRLALRPSTPSAMCEPERTKRGCPSTVRKARSLKSQAELLWSGYAERRSRMTKFKRDTVRRPARRIGIGTLRDPGSSSTVLTDRGRCAIATMRSGRSGSKPWSSSTNPHPIVDARGRAERISMQMPGRGLSRSLLNLAERGGRTSYPQFTAVRGYRHRGPRGKIDPEPIVTLASWPTATTMTHAARSAAVAASSAVTSAPSS